MPVSARLTGRFGVTPVVLSAATINGIGFLALALAPAHLVLLAALGILVGASIPPMMPVVRALYPRMVPADTVRALFAFDTTAQELIWVTGPVVVTVLTSLMSTAVPLLAAAGITLTGSIAFVLSLQPRQPRIARGTSSFGRVLARQEVLLAFVANLALVASFMAMEVGVVAQLGHSMAGVAISVSSLGSLIGGLVLGQRRLGLGALVATLAIVVAGTALTGLATGPLQFVALFAAGFGFAPRWQFSTMPSPAESPKALPPRPSGGSTQVHWPAVRQAPRCRVFSTTRGARPGRTSWPLPWPLARRSAR